MMIIAPHDLGLVRGNQQNTQGDWQDKAVQRANHNQDLGWLTDEIEDCRGKNNKADRNLAAELIQLGIVLLADGIVQK